MKLKIFQSASQGLKVIIKNPIILVLTVLYAVFGCAYFYFFIYLPTIPELGLIIVLFTLVLMFLALVITKLTYDAVKGNISISEAINLSLRKFIFIIIASLLYAFIGLGGLIFLVIPGIFLFNKFIFYSYAILLNNKKIIDSFKESWQIIKGNWWNVFGLHLLFLIPIIILSAISSLMVLNGAIYAALAIDFVWMLLSGWLIVSFTIAYIQLSAEETTVSEEITKSEIVEEK